VSSVGERSSARVAKSLLWVPGSLSVALSGTPPIYGFGQLSRTSWHDPFLLN
jgi:hypothetical protein